MHVLPSVWRNVAIQVPLMQHVSSSHHSARSSVCVCMCVCCGSACVQVCFLLGRCFPVLVTLHHSDRGEEIVGGGGGERDEACEVHYSVQSVIKCRHCVGRAEGLGVSWAGRGGALLSKSSPFQPLSFLGSKKRHLFLQSQSYGAHDFSCTWGGIASWNKTERLFKFDPSLQASLREAKGEDFGNCGNTYVI